MTDNYIADQAVAFRLTATDEGKEALAKAVTEAFEKAFEKKTVIVACPYAQAVEYGTTPARRTEVNVEMTTDPETGDYIPKSKMRFREWIGTKENLHGQDRAKKGDQIYHLVMEEGASPHPYVRPALEDMRRATKEEINAVAGDEENLSMAFAMYLGSRMKAHLDRNKSVVTGNLKKSIIIVPAVLAEGVKEADVSDDKYHWKSGRGRQ